MNRDPSIPQQPSLWRRFAAFKTLLVSFSLVGLLASNVASLVSAGAHDWMHNALWRVLSIGGQAVADRALANSPKAKVEATINVPTQIVIETGIRRDGDPGLVDVTPEIKNE